MTFLREGSSISCMEDTLLPTSILGNDYNSVTEAHFPHEWHPSPPHLSQALHAFPPLWLGLPIAASVVVVVVTELEKQILLKHPFDLFLFFALPSFLLQRHLMLASLVPFGWLIG